MFDRIKILENCIDEVTARPDADHLIELGVDSFVAGAEAAEYIYPRNLLEDLLDLLKGQRAKHYESDNSEVHQLPYDIWRQFISAKPPLESAMDFWSAFERDIGTESGRATIQAYRELDEMDDEMDSYDAHGSI